MMQACLATHVHYFDITGEIEVFELAHSVHEKAQRAGIVLCPGVGFDVVPTDCVAVASQAGDARRHASGARLRQQLGPEQGHGEDGDRIRRQAARACGATARSSKCRSRRSTRRIDFGAGERLAVGIPWGDVSTAYYTTGIPNIEVFTASSPKALKSMRRANMLRPLLRQRWIQRAGEVRHRAARAAARRRRSATTIPASSGARRATPPGRRRPRGCARRTATR